MTEWPGCTVVEHPDGSATLRVGEKHYHLPMAVWLDIWIAVTQARSTAMQLDERIRQQKTRALAKWKKSA